MSDKETSALDELTPKAKARRFRQLLPVIEAKIEAGVRHADIIRALEKHGLALPENTYFTYLRRFRCRPSGAGRQGAQAARTPSQAPAASTVPQPSPVRGLDDAGRRPPTFDYDPRGIPDLLK